MKKTFGITLLFVILAIACAPKENKNNCADSFHDDLRALLNAIQNRNHDKLEAGKVKEIKSFMVFEQPKKTTT